MQNKRDVLVIGAGLSGLVAALRCQEAGLSVTVVAKGMGATHMAPGTIDVLGYTPDLVENPAQELSKFSEANPAHPYARIGTAAIGRALDWFLQRFDGYRYTGSLDTNMLLPTAIGAIKPSALVPATMASGDLRGGARVLFVGLRQLKDFFPALAAENVASAKLPSGAQVMTRAIQIEPPAAEADISGLAFARRFDDPDFRRAVATQVKTHLDEGESAAFPAVLGVQDAHRVWTEMQEALGCPVFEIPSLPPSVPGIRLYNVLSRQFVRAGGRMVVGAEAVGADVEGKRVVSVRVRNAARVRPYEAGAFVLASGGFSAGGIAMDSHWGVREMIFDLPVAGVPAADDERFGPRYLGGHEMGRAGVSVDDSMRPLDGDGNVMYGNLTVVGASLGGSEPWREKSGDGISLTSGYRAADVIIEASA
ncbi:MAG: glycerol-3-phosphate dehydrogenase subunit GlpB [Actinomycetota bacterium]